MTREELLQNAKPILFNTDMVRAILDCGKTVTRRVVKPHHLKVLDSPYHKAHPEVPDDVLIKKLCEPPYHPGDILYVRETWLKTNCFGLQDGYFYKANETPNSRQIREEYGFKWRPSIHMPKDAARIFLRVTDVRVEQLHDITWQQAADEGCYGSTSDEPDPLFHIPTLKGEFAKLWDSTTPKKTLDKYGWDANPWVWVIQFEIAIPGE